MWLTNLKILTPAGFLERGSICIENGIIMEVKEGTAPKDAIDLGGMLALPGFVDLHGDMLEREVHPRPSANIPHEIALCEVDKRLASSGITTAFAAISFAWFKDHDLRSEESARKLIKTVNSMRPDLMVDTYVHARFEITNERAGAVLEDLLETNQIHLVSVMDHTPGQGQYRDIEGYIDFSLEWAKRTENGVVTREMLLKRIEKAQARPKGWEAVRRVTELAIQRSVPLASHDDDTVEKVQLMQSLGVQISEFPVTMEAATHARQLGLTTLMGGPNAYRGASHNANLSARDAAAEGCLDMLASDYYPPGLILAAFKMASEKILPLEAGIRMISTNPAKAIGLHDRGELAAGKRADLVLATPAPWPRVRATLSAGIPIYSDGLAANYSKATLSAGRPQIAPDGPRTHRENLQLKTTTTTPQT